MSDYISREAAKEFFLNMDAGSSRSYATMLTPEEFVEYFDGIPASDVEPVRRGNWHIRFADEMTLCLECSICGRKVDNIDLHYLLEAGEYGEACRMGMEALERTRWIPCSERMPEVGEEVLVYSRSSGMAVDYYDRGLFGYSGVTHWMPLPELPKE